MLRVAAATAFWTDEQAALEQAEGVALIARQIKFRPKSVLTPAGREEGQAPGGMAQVSDLLAARLLVAYHLQHQRPMMGRFLDELGIAHEDGLITEESPTAPEPRRSTRRRRRWPPSFRRPTCRAISGRCSGRTRKRGAACRDGPN